eukprot:5851501-Alexandrium_andersonii.AAC.1
MIGLLLPVTCLEAPPALQSYPLHFDFVPIVLRIAVWTWCDCSCSCCTLLVFQLSAFRLRSG